MESEPSTSSDPGWKDPQTCEGLHQLHSLRPNHKSLNPKFPGGVEMQEEMLNLEGHRVVSTRAGKSKVAGFEQHLVSLASN